MGQLIIGQAIRKGRRSWKESVLENGPDDRLPEALAQMEKSGFLAAHHTSDEVKAMLAETGNLLSHLEATR